MAKEQYFQQPSVTSAQEHFSQVPAVEIERSRFDRSHAHKTTFDAGYLVPVYVDEVLPGDTFTMKHTAFVRLATPLKPIMDNLWLDVHYFFVPNRLVWERWPEFMGERKDPGDDPSVWTMPQREIDRSTTKPAHNDLNLAHYFGLPYTSSADGKVMSVSALPFRAYNLIYNEWYRDQWLQDRLVENVGAGPDTVPSQIVLRRRGKRHDYFTSCLIAPQAGDPIQISLGGFAPVVGIGSLQAATTSTQSAIKESRGIVNYGSALLLDGQGSNKIVLDVDDTTGNPNPAADLSQSTPISINDLRRAFQLQKLAERDMRGGTRYIELILSHFGVRSSDARLQRPEFLGSGSSRININPVAATATDTNVPQGNLAATGTGVNNGGFSKSFEEHGYIIGIASVRADLTYQHGMERHWFRNTRFDFYWPVNAHLGEQYVENREIYYTGDDAQDFGIFGYQERFAEYRYKPSRITGMFNSEASAPLDVWHLAQDFVSPPALNSAFITEAPPVDRVIAVPTEPHFLADFWFDLKCDRPMPVYSIPGFVDHF